MIINGKEMKDFGLVSEERLLKLRGKTEGIQ